TIISAPSNGIAFVQPGTGNILYSPTFGYNGLDSLQYVICDNGTPIYCDTATVSILVGFINLPPVANMDTSTTDQNIPVSTNVLANDTDPNNNIATVTMIGGPSNGLANINSASGLASYLPNFGFFGYDTITYVVCDAGVPVYCDTSIWVITIENENDPPIANDDAAITPPNTSTIIDVQFNDSDPDGDTLSTFVIQNPNYGTVTVLNGDSIIYTPFTGVNSVIDSFYYMVCDNGIPGLCDTALVTVTIPIINIGPVASNEQVNIQEEDTAYVNVLANDYDPNGDSLIVTVVGGPSNGTATLAADGSLVYIPNTNYNGLDTLYYSVCDSLGNCDTAFTVINIIPVNDPPIAVDDIDSTLSNTPIVVAVLANDTDVEGNIDVTSVNVINGPTNGTVTVDPITGDVTYTPSLTFGGIDTFTYVVCDLGLPVYCDTAVVTINVTLSNVPPVVVNDTVSTNEDTPVTISVLSNDFDPDNNIDTSSISIVSGPLNGTAVLDTVTGEILYTPNPNFNGVDSLVYQFCDTGMPIYCDSATVYINVLPVNDPPIAVNDAVTVNEDNPITVSVSTNDTDLDGNLDTLSVTIISAPNNGTALVNAATGNITYTPNSNFNGVDTIVYQICDSGAPVLCDTALLIITVNPVNDPPVAVDDTVNTNEGAAVVIDPLVNDTDIEGGIDPGSVGIIGGPNNGTATVDPVTGQITYTPAPYFNGVDTIVYVVCDSGAPVLCDTATIFITVGAVNNPPIAVDDADTTNEDTPITISVLSNDFDADGNIDPTSVTVIGGPNNGMTIVDPITGAITYIPNMDFFGTDTFTYVICDLGTPIYCDTAVVIITVLPVNDPPVAVNDTVMAQQGSPKDITVDGNDYDLDGSVDPTTVNIIGGPTNGTATVDPITGVITYVPNPNFFGIDSITYVICDNGSPVLCDTATIYINVLPVIETNVFIPNAFSPNGDLIYDFWVIDGIENYPNNVLKIFNRWGNVVYEKKGYDNSWDGKANAGLLVIGDDLPDGTYYYVLDLGEGGKSKAGFVVIKRK
ncbi:MAG: tandem-95 repeat protein, partial [Bacteroidia bacterium]|nr:tandem-95 repeat protein [Bacteroidia bacterium]